MLKDYCIDIIFKTIRGSTLSNITPIYIKFFNGSTDVTGTLFGVSSFSFNSTYWNAASGISINNANYLDFGTFLSDYSAATTLKFYTATDDLFLEYTYTLTGLNGSTYKIPPSGLTISLPNLAAPFASFLLNYLFRNDQTNKPLAWYIDFIKTDNSVYSSRFALDITKFSLPYINEVGEREIAYGKYFYLLASETNNLKQIKLYTGNSGGSSWFSLNALTPLSIFNGRVVEFFNNSLTFSVPPEILDTEFILNDESTSIFYVDFDGRVENLSGNNDIVSLNVSYNSGIKLFKTETLDLTAGNYVEYDDFNLPADFTFQTFIYFTTTPVGRTSIICKKPSAFSLEYRGASAIFAITDGTTDILTTAASLTSNVWYHIYVAKNGDNLRLRINSSVDDSLTLTTGYDFPTNSNPFKVNDLTSPVLGLSNGIYLNSGVLAYNQYVQPLPKRSYFWKNIASHIWAKLTFKQWKEYSK